MPSDFSGHNNVLYGHHMSDGSMFASISNYKQQWYYDAHPYFFLYTNAGKYRVGLFAGIVVPAPTRCSAPLSPPTSSSASSIIPPSTPARASPPARS